YILGKNVKKFEKNLQKYLGSKYAISNNSGTDSLIMSLMCLNLKKNDEVLVPSHTATATLTSLRLMNYKYKFLDIDNDSMNISLKDFKKKINKNTKAIIVVHLYGNPFNVNEIKLICKKKRIRIIEDCAQSFGAMINKKKVGTIGDFGCFSFFPTKNLSAIGDAGAVVTNNNKFYKKLLKIRQYGWDRDRISEINGINSRCDEIQASILNIKIKSIDINNKIRNDIANFYNRELKNLPIRLPMYKKNFYHVYHLYVIRVSKLLRNKIIKFFQSNNINLGIHYKTPCHKMKNFFLNDVELPITDKVVDEIITLPLYPELKKKYQLKTVRLLKQFYKENSEK
ncbi:DegT/DnrJ/EryC1/StrS family aminotransferase, partial [Pelagibacteraceae bacterium]|nr:DegT/DnrJ/EryC1/StrS family aminotransferase [Pelagibacteraceae bacterium]